MSAYPLRVSRADRDREALIHAAYPVTAPHGGVVTACGRTMLAPTAHDADVTCAPCRRTLDAADNPDE